MDRMKSAGGLPLIGDDGDDSAFSLPTDGWLMRDNTDGPLYHPAIVHPIKSKAVFDALWLGYNSSRKKLTNNVDNAKEYAALGVQGWFSDDDGALSKTIQPAAGFGTSPFGTAMGEQFANMSGYLGSDPTADEEG